MLSDFLLCQPT